MIFGVIVAGGVGSRLGADMPKQFLKLADRPIIIYTLNTFLQCPELEDIYIGVHPEWLEYMARLVREYIPEQEWLRVHLVPGGAERNETIMNVITQIEQEFGNEEPHYGSTPHNSHQSRPTEYNLPPPMFLQYLPPH